MNQFPIIRQRQCGEMLSHDVAIALSGNSPRDASMPTPVALRNEMTIQMRISGLAKSAAAALLPREPLPTLLHRRVGALPTPARGPASQEMATLVKSGTEFQALGSMPADGTTKLSANVDGKPIRNLRRVKSNVFSVARPEENLFDAPCIGANRGHVPAGVFAPAVDEGYCLRIRPLKAGPRTVDSHAEESAHSFVLDVNYTLTVVPRMVDVDDEEDD